jgi:hypothetical protein
MKSDFNSDSVLPHSYRSRRHGNWRSEFSRVFVGKRGNLVDLDGGNYERDPHKHFQSVTKADFSASDERYWNYFRNHGIGTSSASEQREYCRALSTPKWSRGNENEFGRLSPSNLVHEGNQSMSLLDSCAELKRKLKKKSNIPNWR